MSPFSVRIRAEILAAFPGWEAHAAEETWQGSDPYLVVTVPAPVEAGTSLPLRISTWDEEVTVDFDHYHTHFERWNPDPADTRHQSALLYVRDLLAERMAVASWWQGEHCKVCAQWEPGTSLEPGLNVAYSRVRVRSWRGSHNSDTSHRSEGRSGN